MVCVLVFIDLLNRVIVIDQNFFEDTDFEIISEVHLNHKDASRASAFFIKFLNHLQQLTFHQIIILPRNEMVSFWNHNRI